MAIQNFLSGGYYGKLGDTVGQRWRNKRTIRSWVIPNNPKTEAQQANRGFFGSMVQWAQMSLSMTYGGIQWTEQNTTQWAAVMGACLAINKSAQRKDVGHIATVPANFTSDYVISGLVFSSSIPNTEVQFTLQGNYLQKAAEYTLMLYFDSGSRQGEYFLLRGATTSESPQTLVCHCENTIGIGSETVFAKIISIGAATSAEICFSERLQIQNASAPAFAQTFAVSAISGNNNGTITAVIQMSEYGADLIGQFAVENIQAAGAKMAKARCQAAGGEYEQNEVDAAETSINIVSQTCDTTTGALTVTFAPASANALQYVKYTDLAFTCSWTNAKTSETSLSSGTAAANGTLAKTYLWPAFTVSIQPEYRYYYNEVSDGSLECAAIWELVGADFIAAFVAQYETLNSVTSSAARYAYPISASKGTAEASYERPTFSVTQQGELFWENATLTIAAWEGQGDLNDLTSVTFSPMTIEVIDANFAYAGAFDDAHLWTKCPAIDFGGAWEEG